MNDRSEDTIAREKATETGGTPPLDISQEVARETRETMKEMKLLFRNVNRSLSLLALYTCGPRQMIHCGQPGCTAPATRIAHHPQTGAQNAFCDRHSWETLKT